MLKIKKGIKKKIKGKKDKGKDDLFDPEQLAKFKKELEEGKKSPLPPDTEHPEHTTATLDHEQDEEWLKFKQLTSGVDHILKKTTGDLDRIKSSSYFQRTSEANQKFASESAGSSRSTASVRQSDTSSKQSDTSRKEGGWIGFEKGHAEEKGSDSESEDPHNKESCISTQIGASEHKEFEIPEDVAELDDSLFDTSFVDAVASGEIKLAYIPDSPQDDQDDDDPFDTSAVADVVKQIEEEEKKRKKRVNLGNTVDFLTKKTDTFGTSAAGVDSQKKPRPRPHNINLIGSFDDDSQFTIVPCATDNETGNQPKDPFEEIIYSPSTDKSVSLIDSANPPLILASEAPTTKSSVPEDLNKTNLKNILTEFDVICDSTANASETIKSLAIELNSQTDEDDEFALLAAESLHKSVHIKGSDEVAPDSLATQKISNDLDELENNAEEEIDPFDTTFVENLQACSVNLKSTELNEDDFDFNPRADETASEDAVKFSNPQLKPTDLLDTTDNEHHNIREAVILPEAELVLFVSDQDPFDTSSIETVLPGKTELKLLEEELLKINPSTTDNSINILSVAASSKDVVTKDEHIDISDDEFDFDPRAGELKVEREHPLDIQEVPLCAKVLTPIFDVAKELDPFDTSIVTNTVIPGKVELRLLENELISREPLNSTSEVCISQSDVNTISFSTNNLNNSQLEQSQNDIVLIETSNVQRDVFESHENLTCEKTLTPLQSGQSFVEVDTTEFIDPFDTSNVDVESINKADLKILEGELLNSTEDIAPKRAIVQFVPQVPIEPELPPAEEPKIENVSHILETDFLVDESSDHTLVTPLQPQEIDFGIQPSFNDPFDTSIAEAIPGPCKVELKILEEELNVEPGLTRSVTDPDFNPRQIVHPCVELTSLPLTPQLLAENSASAVVEEEFDPFDTSHAVDLIPGKTELKILEAELL